LTYTTGDPYWDKELEAEFRDIDARIEAGYYGEWLEDLQEFHYGDD
jgi:hypothetical protein